MIKKEDKQDVEISLETSFILNLFLIFIKNVCLQK